jgi:Fuc2NAc and GlcNAc transferase
VFVVFIAPLLAACLSWWLLAIFLPVLRRRFLDQPNQRSSHRVPTARGGGVVFVLVASVASGISLLSASLPALQLPQVALSLATFPLAVVGFLDDRQNLPPGWRYGVQLFTAWLLLLLSPMAIPWIAFPLLLIAVTAVINFVNFMDGLDGLVAGCMAVALAAAALKLSAPWPVWALVGALLGFLVWNWSPAKVFMGDVGSTYLGAVFAGLVLQVPSWPDALALLLVATPLVGDACVCVPRRFIAGQRVFQAHRLHLFQRLHQAGWPHARVSSLYVSATAVLAMALLTGGLLWVLALAALELLIGVWLDQRVAVPFAVASRS